MDLFGGIDGQRLTNISAQALQSSVGLGSKLRPKESGFHRRIIFVQFWWLI